MYCDFYQLRERPFNVTADPKFLYLNARYREALASLQYGITQRKGFVTLIGEAGTGKTTLLKKLLDELDEGTRTVFIFNTNVTFDEILEYIFAEFDLPVHNGKRLYMLQRLNAFLLEELQHGRNVALLIDEAQDLDQVALEDLRLLSNLETAKEKILQIVLSGQPELGQKLGSPGLRQLRQRVAINCRLLPLTREEISEYIQSRLMAAGGADPKLFTRDAEDRIYEISMGIPRLVNVVCDNSLVIGYALGKRRIGAEVVTEAAADLLTMEPPQEVADTADAPIAVTAAPRSRRWSQLGVVAVVLVAIVVGLLSVGRSLLQRPDVPAVVANDSDRGPLPVIQPGTRGESDPHAREARPMRNVPAPAPVAREEIPVAPAPQAIAPAPAVQPQANVPDRGEPDTEAADPRDPEAAAPSAPNAPVVAANPRIDSNAIARNPQAFDAVPPPAREPAQVAAVPPGAVVRQEAVPPQVPAAVANPPAIPPVAAPVVAAPTLGAPIAVAPARVQDDRGVALALQHYQTVTVNPGQSISELAVRQYGQASPTILDVVKLANPNLRNVDVISVGQTLQLPQLDDGLVVLRQGQDQYALLLLSSPAWQRVKNLEVVLRQRGLQAQVQETDFGPGRTVYRLMIGGLSSREAAVNTGKKVQRLFREDDQVAALAR